MGIFPGWSRASQRLRFAIYFAKKRSFSTDVQEWPFPIYASKRIRDRKSIFLAHASSLPNDKLLPLFFDILTVSPELKKATHFMYAYRTESVITSNSKSRIVTGQHDGGESGSGNHLARLLQVMGCENTIVVVSRWYGGVQLGGDRWRRITEVAKEALEKGEFVAQKNRDEPSKKKGRKKK